MRDCLMLFFFSESGVSFLRRTFSVWCVVCLFVGMGGLLTSASLVSFSEFDNFFFLFNDELPDVLESASFF